MVKPQYGVPLLDQMKVVALLAKAPENTVVLYSHVSRIIIKRVCSDKEHIIYGIDNVDLAHFILATIRLREINSQWEPAELGQTEKIELLQLCVYICQNIHKIDKALVNANMEFIRNNVVRAFNRITDTSYIESGFFSDEIQPFSALVPVVLYNMLTPGLSFDRIEHKLLSRAQSSSTVSSSASSPPLSPSPNSKSEVSQLIIFFSRFRCDYLAQISSTSSSIQAKDILPLLTRAGKPVIQCDPLTPIQETVNLDHTRHLFDNQVAKEEDQQLTQGSLSLFKINDKLSVDQIGVINVILSIMRLPNGECQCCRASVMCTHIKQGDGLFSCFVRRVATMCIELEIKTDSLIINSAMKDTIMSWIGMQFIQFRYLHIGPVLLYT
jgi:hypothetical protein